uniref:FtsX-like permease family protein n=1 Tax=Cellulomonas citrea TaxID=1909423 RepID=UPI0013587991
SGSVTANAQAGGAGSGVVIAPLDLLDRLAPSSPVVAVWAGLALALLGFGVLGGAVSFVGILVGAVLWIPRVVAAVGRLMQGFGPAARLAAANTLRNPRRTAATSTALLIGVTLVVTMSTGAATARSSIDELLDSHFPVDLVAAGTQGAGSDATLPARTLTTVQDVPGIGAAVPVRAATAELDGRPVTVYGLPVDQAATVLRDTSLVRALSEGKVLVPKDEPTQVTLTSSEHSGSVTANAQAGGAGSGVVIAPLDLLDRLAPSSPVVAVWARLAPDVTAATVLQDVQDALADSSVSVASAAAEREYYEQIIDTLLGIVVGLLAVAVVIALIGVTNTLSLSVLERRRESATLRALGMTRRQLRTTLAAEGMVIAGVSAVLGAALGLLYGWAGSAVVFGVAAKVQLAVPWGDLATVLVVALLAGLTASVVPARTAARTPPVAALAVE